MEFEAKPVSPRPLGGPHRPLITLWGRAAPELLVVGYRVASASRLFPRPEAAGGDGRGQAGAGHVASSNLWDLVGEEPSGDILNIEERPNGLEMMPGSCIARTNVPPD